MKRITYIFRLSVSILLLTGFTACADFLDKEPDDMLTLDMIFNDKVRTEDWLAGVYSKIPDSYEGMMRYIGYDALGDDQTPSPGWEQFGGWHALSKQNGNWSAASHWDVNYWNELPKRIRSAYIFIENVRPNAAQLVTETEVELMKNEARAMIAYYYTLLCEIYGPVPLNLGIVPNDAPEDELMNVQTPFDEIVDWIDKELKEVAGNLPPYYSQAQKYGRFTSIMCLAVRARLLLFAASPLVNGNPDYANHVNKNGEHLFNSKEDPQKWIRAAEACKELIDAAHAAGHALYYERNADGSIDPFLSYQNMMFRKYNDGNKEILFARPDTKYEEIDKHATPRGTGGFGGLGVTQKLVDAFFMDNGLSPILGYHADGSPIINPESGYVEKGFSTTAELRKTRWTEVQYEDTPEGAELAEGIVTLPNTYNMYTHREPRFYISVLYNRAWYRREKRRTLFCRNEPDGGPTHDAPQGGYLVRKKVHPDSDARSGQFVYRPGILYRLGEAYLNYAEALNECSPGHPDILTYLNLIRERAGIPEYGTGAGKIPVPEGQAAMREAIHRERQVELNCENGLRYHDLRRWKQAEKELNGDFWGMDMYGTEPTDDDNNEDSFFKRVVYQKRVFVKRYYWFPVPQSEMDINPNLVQAPFWNLAE